jgi:DNA-binding beta-propeller fold protein YncE
VLGCAAQLPREEVPELYWPLPPEKPRIKFVDLIIGSIDVTGVRSGKFKQLLFGEEPEVGFLKPSFVAARDRVLYITDIGRVHVYDFKRKEYRAIGGRLLTPTGIAVGPNSVLYVADSSRRALYIISPEGKFTEIKGFATPGGVALDEKRGRVLVCDTKKHQVVVLDTRGRRLFSIGRRGRGPGQFNFPYDVAVDKEGRIYVVDSGNFRVQILAPNGQPIRAFGTVGMVPGTFARPKGIALDSQGHIYVVDAAFGNFQIFDRLGRVYLAVGTNGLAPGQFQLPAGIAIDERDRIYVVDQMNRRIQVFQYLRHQ